MAIKQTIHCDISGRELEPHEAEKMTVCNILYKKHGTIKDPRDDSDIHCLLDLQSYQLHISAGRSAEFMEGIKELLKKLRS